ncbi:MAG: biosynthetic-type acetolactate synthase large subunit [Marinilabiliaceae bacterium]|nr:biosynthetic-type acetolactate synthase large subunit [Marinilabiliaceae bacterium]
MKHEFTGAQLLLKRLQQHGIDIIFGIPGGNILPIYDAMKGFSIRHILAKHEQGAGFMAQGMSRSTRKASVCMATSGPGATNLITAISDAWSDSVPMVIITGQVSQSMKNTDAFQEVDIVSMVATITKKSYYVASASDIVPIVDEAFKIAESGRPGPVLIDIPKDVQLQQCVWDDRSIISQTVSSEIDKNKIAELATLLNASKKPVIISGNGAIISNVSFEIKKLVEKQNIPMVTTLHGIGILPSDHPMNLGLAGMHGFKLANKMLSNADLVLAFGIRFDDRLTGNINEFCTNATIVHIDISARELNRLKPAKFIINANLKDVLSPLVNLIGFKNRDKWINEIFDFRASFNENDCVEEGSPEWLINTISKLADKDAIVTTDVGQHQIWVAQSYQFNKPKTFLTSGGQGTMGFGLPAAIGAAVANPDKQIICFTGDGSLLMNIQELATMAELGLNIKIFVINNSSLGMVRQQQDLFYNQNFEASRYAYQFNFRNIARAFNIDASAFSCDRIDFISLQSFMMKKGPFLFDITIDETEMVTPIFEPGRSINNMKDCKRTIVFNNIQ